MTMRAWQDWSPLGWSTDPVPGDHDDVATTAWAMGATRDSLGSASTNLRRLTTDDTCSEAITKLVEASSELASQLDMARSRYDAASEALGEYAPVLQDAQRVSLEALTDATQANARYRQHQSTAEANYQQARACTDPVQQQQFATAVLDANRQANAAAGDLQAAKHKLQTAIDERDHAADLAAAKIDGAVRHSPLNDSGWDKFKKLAEPVIHAVQGVAKWVWDHIDAIALVLTILAVIFAAVPVVGEVLAVLAIAARGLALIKSFVEFGKDVFMAIKNRDLAALAKAIVLDGGAIALSLIGGRAAAKFVTKFGPKLGKPVLSLAAKALSKVKGSQLRMPVRITNLVSKSFGPVSRVARRLLIEPRPPAKPLPFVPGFERALRAVHTPRQIVTKIADDLHLGNVDDLVDEVYGDGVDAITNVVKDHWHTNRSELQVCR